MSGRIPVVGYLKLDGDPHLQAQACRACGALYLDRRIACARCESREFDTRDLENTGTVRTFTIVHRSPGKVSKPYASALVEVDGGGLVKANIIGVNPTPDAIRAGMRVRLATFVAGRDDEGTEAIAFGYEPLREEGS